MKSRRLFLKLLGILIAIAIVFSVTSCNLFGGGTLTISNYGSDDIDYVRWNGVSFGDDIVYDFILDADVWGIAAFGGSDTEQVEIGSDYITFYFWDSAQKYRTAELVDVRLFADGSFTLYDSTIIYTAALQGGETESRTYSIIPIPGSKLEE